MTRSEIIKQVRVLTENKGAEQLDYNLLFSQRLQGICSSHRYWWRKKRLSFATVNSTVTYDLTQVATTPAAFGPYVDEITKIFRVDTTNQVSEIVPVFDDEAVCGMVVDTATTDKPSSYTIESNDLVNFQTIRLSPIPNGVFTIYVFFWGMPNPTSDSDDTVPILPATKHHILVTGLEMDIWRITYGEQDPKYKTALDAYDAKLAQEKMKPSFSTQKSNLFKGNEEDAIRSTRLRN